MEQQGVLRSWNDAKGFGFIRTPQGDEYFVHISSVHGAERPQQGNQVVFIPGSDRQGRPRAKSMRSLGQSSLSSVNTGRPSSRRQRPHSTHAHGLKKTLSVLLVVCAIPAIGAWQAFQHSALLWPLLIYSGASLLAIALYWRDKHSAQNSLWRIPESHLHAVELFGGWPGALLAQQLLRHKTRKASYQGVFWLIVLGHQVYWLDQLGLDGQLLQQLLDAL